MVDFFSVGTNDLTQYTLACDRQNPDIEEFIDTHHEAILRLIEMSAENAHKNGAWIGICGELARRYHAYGAVPQNGNRRAFRISQLRAEGARRSTPN